MELKVMYFAWLREKVGRAQDNVSGVLSGSTVFDLMHRLSALSPRHAEAFLDISGIRVAVNQEHVSVYTPLSENDEVAFFPPVTGG